MKFTDQEILHVLTTGGPRVHKVMDYVYLSSRKKIILYVVKNSGSKEDGQDVLQDAVSSFYTNIKNGKFRGESDVEGYLFGIARNKWRKVLHKRQKARDVDKTNVEGKMEEEAEIKGVVERVDGALERMSEDCKEVLVHAFYYNYSAAELREKFQFKNEQVARNKKYKCLKRLREMMTNFKIR